MYFRLINQYLAINKARTEALALGIKKDHFGAYRLEAYGTFTAQRYVALMALSSYLDWPGRKFHGRASRSPLKSVARLSARSGRNAFA